MKVVRGIRNQQSFYITDEYGEETGEDVAIDDNWNYADILWNGIQAETVQRAFHKLNYQEQTLLEQKSKNKHKKKITTAIYEYQADSDGE